MAPNVCRVSQLLSRSLTMVLIAIVRYHLPAMSCICIASWVSQPPFLGILSSSCKWGKWSSATQVLWYQAGHTELWCWSSLISKSVVFRWRHLNHPTRRARSTCCQNSNPYSHFTKKRSQAEGHQVSLHDGAHKERRRSWNAFICKLQKL